MREIKFRAWHKSSVTNGSPYMDYILYLDNVGINDQIKIAEDRNWILMQYTGLKDKNGKKIYEGDIVKYGYADFEEDKTIHKIKYFADNDYPAFDFVPNLGCDCNGLAYAMAEGEIEIIGNIYENPELLKEI